VIVPRARAGGSASAQRGAGRHWRFNPKRERRCAVVKTLRQLAIAANWPVLLAVALRSAVGLATIWADTPADGQKQLLFLAIGVGACCCSRR